MTAIGSAYEPLPPDPATEEPPGPRRRELDLEPAGEVAQPKITAREIEL